MRRIAVLLAGSIVVACTTLVAGCGGPPAANPLLIDAESAYEVASSDSLVASRAPVALEEANEELQTAQRLWRSGGDRAEIDHHAYLARQRVRIAEQSAQLSAAEEQIKRAKDKRNEIQLQARTAEVENAERRAEDSRRQAEQAREAAAAERKQAETARQEAQRAFAQAEALARRVEELEATRTERGLILTLGDVLFDVGRSELKAGAMATIDKVASFLKEYPERSVLIEGHTDNTGSSQTNLDLSRRRADAVRQSLLERGISSERVRTRGYGAEYPVASNSTAEGRQRNRRVDIVISDKAGMIPERQ